MDIQLVFMFSSEVEPPAMLPSEAFWGLLEYDNTRGEMIWGRILAVLWAIWLLCNEQVFKGRAILT